MGRKCRFLSGLLFLVVQGAIAEVTTPEAVSPGEYARPATIESRCPTFSWAPAKGAVGHEIVVYDVTGESSSEPALQLKLPGAVSSWTPALDGCLRRGGVYAWTVRATEASTSSEWCTPRLFRVSDGARRPALEEALLVIREYMARGDDTRQFPGGGETSGATGRSSDAAAPSAAIEALPSRLAAALTVEGEVRTVDSSARPRLWGRGRPGTDVFLEEGSDPPSLCENGSIEFGLSVMMVDWGSAADACPAGTWVCTEEERGSEPCPTVHPGGMVDCTGTVLPISQWGWLADSVGNWAGLCIGETGGSSCLAASSCNLLPVWCCRY